MSNKHSQTCEKLFEAKIPGEETGIEIKKTLCSVCGFQCAIDAYVKDGRLIKVEGYGGKPRQQGDTLLQRRREQAVDLQSRAAADAAAAHRRAG